MKIGSLFMSLGFDVDDDKLKDFNESIMSTRTKLLAVGAVAAGAAYGINSFVGGFADQAVALSNFTEQTGESTDAVQRFYNVAGRLNTDITLDQTIAAFTALRDTISQAQFGEGAIQEAMFLGIPDIAELSPSELIRRLREGFAANVSQWGEARTIDMMEALGLGRSFIESIRVSDAEFNRLANNPIMSGEQIQNLEEYALAMKELGFQWNMLMANLAEDIAIPVLDKINEAIENFKWFMSEKEIAAETSPNLSNVSQRGITEAGLFSGLASYGEAFMLPLRAGYGYLSGDNNTVTNNNISVESTAPADEVAIEVINRLDQQNKGTVTELPEPYFGGAR